MDMYSTPKTDCMGPKHGKNKPSYSFGITYGRRLFPLRSLPQVIVQEAICTPSILKVWTAVWVLTHLLHPQRHLFLLRLHYCCQVCQGATPILLHFIPFWEPMRLLSSIPDYKKEVEVEKLAQGLNNCTCSSSCKFRCVNSVWSTKTHNFKAPDNWPTVLWL